MNREQFDAIELGQEVCTVTGPGHQPTRDLAAQVGEVVEKTNENGARYCLVRFTDGTEDTMHSYHEPGGKGIGWYLLNDANFCRVCMKQDGEMDFALVLAGGLLTTLTKGPGGVLLARICLACWGMASEDLAIAFCVVQKRKGWLPHIFPWYKFGMTMEQVIADQGQEVADQVKAYMLREKKPK